MRKIRPWDQLASFAQAPDHRNDKTSRTIRLFGSTHYRRCKGSRSVLRHRASSCLMSVSRALSEIRHKTLPWPSKIINGQIFRQTLNIIAVLQINLLFFKILLNRRCFISKKCSKFFLIRTNEVQSPIINQSKIFFL